MWLHVYHKQNIRRKEKHLIVVLVQHDDNLSHVVELGDSTEVIHGTLPLLVLLLLLHTHTQTYTDFVPPLKTFKAQPDRHLLTSSKPP